MIKVILSTFIVFYLLGCQGVLEYEQPQEPQLSIFAIIELGSPITATLSKSISAYEIDRSRSIVDSVLVEVWINGILSDTLKRIDDFTYISKNYLYIEGNSYRFKVTDLNHQLRTLFSEKVIALNAPKIQTPYLDILPNVNGTVERINITFEFTNNNNLTFLGYSFFSDLGAVGFTLDEKFKCSEEIISNYKSIQFIELDCLDRFDLLQFNSQSIDTSRTAFLTIEICLTDQLTEDFLRVLPLNQLGDFKYGSILAADDRPPTNIRDGYGAILNISCDRLRIKL